MTLARSCRECGHPADAGTSADTCVACNESRFEYKCSLHGWMPEDTCSRCTAEEREAVRRRAAVEEAERRAREAARRRRLEEEKGRRKAARAAARRRGFARLMVPLPHLICAILFIVSLRALQQWEPLHFRGYLGGLLLPTLILWIAITWLITRSLFTSVWSYVGRPTARPELTVLVLTAGVLVGGFFLWPQVQDRRYEHVLAEAASARAGQQWDAAIQLLTHATEEQPTRMEGFLELASILQHVGRLDDADRALVNAAAVDPFHPRLHMHLGLLYQSRGWPTSTRLAFQRAHYLDPADTEVAILLACAHMVTGEEETVRELFGLAGNPGPDACP
jgi:tetratricopeptide (TPR) repeat protein